MWRRHGSSCRQDLLPWLAPVRGHKTDTSETTRATPRDASQSPATARFAGETVSRVIAQPTKDDPTLNYHLGSGCPSFLACLQALQRSASSSHYLERCPRKCPTGIESEGASEGQPAGSSPNPTIRRRNLREPRHQSWHRATRSFRPKRPGEWATPGSAQTGTGTGLEQLRDDAHPHDLTRRAAQSSCRVRVERGIYRQSNGKCAACCATRFRTVGFDLAEARRVAEHIEQTPPDSLRPPHPRHTETRDVPDDAHAFAIASSEHRA
jgi:hypothetical protein